MTNALKPCPFCGSPPEYCEGKFANGDAWHYYACSQCEATQPYLSSAELSRYDESFNRERSAEAWNDRPTERAAYLRGLKDAERLAEEFVGTELIAAIRALAEEDKK